MYTTTVPTIAACEKVPFYGQAKVIEALEDLHSPVTRYLPYEGSEVSYDTQDDAEEAHAYDCPICCRGGDCGWERDFFQVCGECARIEQDPGCSTHDFKESLWPCRTAQLLERYLADAN